jgi:inorganic pyrophosphatase
MVYGNHSKKDKESSENETNALLPFHSSELMKFKSDETTKDAVIFYGVPFKNPLKKDKIVISPTMFSTSSIFYEFGINDIITWDEVEKIVNPSGTSLTLIKLYVRRGSVAIRYEPVLIE